MDVVGIFQAVLSLSRSKVIAIMTPTTPPTSRGGRGSRNIYSFEGASHERKGQLNEPQTPHRGSQSQVPVTPSTTRAFKQPIPALGAPSLGNQIKSPFRGFNSPEYTPQNQLSKNQTISFEPPGELQNVSRVLFPAPNEGNSQTAEEPAPLSLLPPKRPTATRRSLSSELLHETEEYDDETSNKMSKQVPGTPSHKVVTFDMAQEWNNPVELAFDSDDDDFKSETFVSNKELVNPFTSSNPTDEKLIQQRKEALLQENPDIEDVITYVDKKGEVVRRRQLSENEKKLYSPRRLFADEIKVLEDSKKQEKDEKH